MLTLMTMPQAKGLFQKGIVESGAVETMGVKLNSAEASARVAERTLKHLGITTDQVERLQDVPY